MKINMTVKELFEMQGPLKKIANQELPTIASLKILKIVDVFSSEMKPVSEAVNKIYKKFGKEKDGRIIVLPENIEKFQKELDIINAEMVEFSIREQLDIKYLDSIKLSAMDLNALKQFIKQEKEEDVKEPVKKADEKVPEETKKE